MNIQPINSQTTFTARNKEIRYADHIMRNLNNQYPVISSTRAPFYITIKKHPFLRRLTYATYNKLNDIRNSIESSNTRKITDEVIKSAKESKLGNCGEMALMSKAAFLANGYKDVKLVQLKLKTKIVLSNYNTTNDIDHGFLIVNAGKHARASYPKTYNKHAFIVDPWAGFVDYVPSAFTKYEQYFMNGNKVSTDNHGKKIQKFILGEIESFKTRENTCDRFAKKYPELIVDEHKQ